ncbi:substrate-binding domain-containing protein [Paenibacillus arenilitoris]|uniref:Substrate-binding domain-containing protein n=1 Tax=Paenibacillus arenilitoris TaxID=2772299 RepID=A0A927CSM4_9BACL|nr:substrate-binding domain-containing protein [Paenibacillus arenilitoris]MBD2870865.1 substrate-binding domain-containing protein [Paenibacillus arenilitoris]
MNRRLAIARISLLGTALLLAAVLLASCRAAGLGEAEKAPMRIVLIAPVHAGEQGDAMRLGAEAAVKEFGAELDYIAFEPHEDEKEQLAAALAAVEGGASAVLIDPAGDEVLGALAHEASAQGAPVVTLNDERGAKGVQTSITADYEEAGRQAGEAMAELLGGSGTVAVMRPDRPDPDMERREVGARAALAEYAGITVTDGAACGNSRDACWQAAKQMLDHLKADGALALEASASLGLADEVKRRGEQGKLKIVTFGSEMEQLELLQEGSLHKLVVQNGFSTGYLGVKQAVSLLSGERVDKLIRLETRVIDADNMFWMNNQKMLFPFVQ